MILSRLAPFVFFVASVMSLGAEPLDTPDSNVLLTVTGNVAVTNVDAAARFDRPMLEALEWRDVETYTSFTEGLQVFSGPTLKSLLDALGVTEGVLHASAINDYTIAIDVSDAAEHDVLLAMDWNGTPMRVRDKGPIWLIYPLSKKEAASNVFSAEMIWQLDRIRVE